MRPFTRISAATAAFLLSAMAAAAQIPFFGFPDFGDLAPSGTHPQKKAYEFDYDLDFQYLFDNREFNGGKQKLEKSQTLNAARVVPWAGIRINQSSTVTHRIMAGAEFTHDMGAGSLTVGEEGLAHRGLSDFEGLMLYYKAEARLRRGVFSAVAGIYPLSEFEGDYSQAFISDYSRFYDNEAEGMLFKYRSQRFSAELGLDWTGMYGTYRREQFRIYSAGLYGINKTFSAGWAAQFGHFANGDQIIRVMDDHLFNPYLKADIGHLAGLDELSLKAGGIFAYERDRRYEKTPCFPYGGEFEFKAQRHSLGIENTLYAGEDLMPYYETEFTAEDGSGSWKNANLLYRGLGFYRTSFVGAKWYNRTEAWWRPHVASFLDLEIALEFHFMQGLGMLGSQQKVSLIFDLDAVRHPSHSSGRRTVKTGRKTHKSTEHTIPL